MTEIVEETQDTGRAERPVLRRSFEAEITPGDGRTIDVRVIRYNTPAEVADPPDFATYREEWAPGVFDDQLQAPNRLLANVEHQLGIGGIVGRGVSYSSDSEAFYATVRMLNGQDADKTLELVNDGVFGGISLEAYPKKSVRTAAGTVRRMKAHLDKIAFCRRPAFEDAVVLAVREEIVDEVVLEEALLPLDMDPAIFERMKALGIRLPTSAAVMRAFTERPWDGSESRWPDAASYCAASLVDNNPDGEPKTKAQCHFPVREPGSGDVNVNALRAVVGGRGAQADFPGAEKGRAEARRLLAEYERQRANRAAPVNAPDNAEAASALRAIIAACERFIAAETDSEDRDRVRQMMTTLRGMTDGRGMMGNS